MIQKTHVLPIAYEHERIILEFFKNFHVEYTKRYTRKAIVFTANMTRRVFDAFCDTILDCNKYGIYPIAL